MPERHDLDWVTDDLAVGGRCAADLDDLTHVQRLGAVVDLRAEERVDPEAWTRFGVRFLALPTDDHAAISPEMLASGLSFAAQARTERRRLLLHCQHGIGRSAMLALVVLVERGFGAMDALMLLKTARPRISPSVAQIEAWRGWLSARGRAAPSFEDCAAVAYARPGR